MRTLHRWLASLKTAVFLLTLLSALSLIGTLIPQERELGIYQTMFPKAASVILALGFDDLYRSVPFVLTLWLLALSTLICTWTRFKITRRRLFHRLELAGTAEIRSYSLLAHPSPAILDVSRLDDGWHRRDDADGTGLFLRVSGRAALIGGLLIHVGLLIILAGGLWGTIQGVETAIRGCEGDVVAVPPRDAIAAGRDGDRLRRLYRRLRQANSSDPRLPGLEQQIAAFDATWQAGRNTPPFKLRFNKLWIDFHDQTASEAPVMTRNWNSAVTVIEQGREVASAVIRVNEPFSWKGYSFFQSDWSKSYRAVRLEITPIAAEATLSPAEAPASHGSIASGEAKPAPASGSAAATPIATAASVTATATATAVPEPGKTYTVDAVIGVPFKPEWSPYSFVILDFFPDFRIVDGQFVTVSQELNNPAARIQAYGKDDKIVGRAWAFPAIMGEMSGRFSDLRFRFTTVGAEPAYETGLQVVSNPSVPVVWLGCILMTLGLCLSFYVTYCEEWIILEADGRFTVAVTGNRPPISLKPVFDGLVRDVTGATGSVSSDTPSADTPSADTPSSDASRTSP